jgi:hypothetical protein
MISSVSFYALTKTLGLAAILLLLLLLIVKELLRTSAGPQSRIWMGICDIVIVPLMIVFGLVMFIRIFSL